MQHTVIHVTEGKHKEDDWGGLDVGGISYPSFPNSQMHLLNVEKI